MNNLNQTIGSNYMEMTLESSQADTIFQSAHHYPPDPQESHSPLDKPHPAKTPNLMLDTQTNVQIKNPSNSVNNKKEQKNILNTKNINSPSSTFTYAQEGPPNGQINFGEEKMTEPVSILEQPRKSFHTRNAHSDHYSVFNIVN
jgi:hypothetical protein